MIAFSLVATNTVNSATDPSKPSFKPEKPG